MAYPTNPWQDHDQVSLEDENERKAFEKAVAEVIGVRFSATQITTATEHVKTSTKMRGRAYVALLVAQALFDPHIAVQPPQPFS